MDERTSAAVSAIAAVIAIVISVPSLIVGCIAISQSQSANNLASDANRIASNAATSSRQQHDAGIAFQERLRILEEYAKEPRILTLRSIHRKASVLVATIQNEGGRPAAMFDIRFTPVGEPLYGAMPNASIPVDNASKSLQVDLREYDLKRPFTFTRPPILEPGGIINIEIAYPPRILHGEFSITYSKGQVVNLGYFDQRPSAPSPF
ncbi:hypothetical protein [Crateriforma conspicua]|uniref:Uncharacterized protein n=1 Tax=Crateriforma conspicua TaxID=2527996 RepID=A0A5C5YC06_9PLAN|nr:hypothetical protein [Crateriforma conspicua]TWT72634.1 hypothetical protein Pan14r_49540 [Crateriforma conspicua]